MYRVNDGALWYGPVLGTSRTSRAVSDEEPLQQQVAPKDSDGRNVVACLSFLNGKCTRPDCRFVHLRPEVRLLPTSVCAYFARQEGCSKGGQCRYFHGPAAVLNHMKQRGVVMYNPFTNEPYETMPEQLEGTSERRGPQYTVPTTQSPQIPMSCTAQPPPPLYMTPSYDQHRPSPQILLVQQQPQPTIMILTKPQVAGTASQSGTPVNSTSPPQILVLSTPGGTMSGQWAQAPIYVIQPQQ